MVDKLHLSVTRYTVYGARRIQVQVIHVHPLPFAMNDDALRLYRTFYFGKEKL